MIVSEKVCRVDGCQLLGKKDSRTGRHYLTRGLCNKHYTRFRKTGNTSDSALRKTHGEGRMTNPLYKTYLCMKERCGNPNRNNYERYGGRGVKVHKDWLDPVFGFRKFEQYIVTTLGQKPGEAFTLDRIDNDGNYEPGNLRWASPLLQNLNKRPTRRNKTGKVGVFFDRTHKGRNKWAAYIRVEGKLIHLGRYSQKAEAIEARESAELMYFQPVLSGAK